jgi:hypothetical protein
MGEMRGDQGGEMQVAGMMCPWYLGLHRWTARVTGKPGDVHVYHMYASAECAVRPK